MYGDDYKRRLCTKCGRMRCNKFNDVCNKCKARIIKEKSLGGIYNAGHGKEEMDKGIEVKE